MVKEVTRKTSTCWPLPKPELRKPPRGSQPSEPQLPTQYVEYSSGRVDQSSDLLVKRAAEVEGYIRVFD